jgi:hypothetical protein
MTKLMKAAQPGDIYPINVDHSSKPFLSSLLCSDFWTRIVERTTFGSLREHVRPPDKFVRGQKSRTLLYPTVSDTIEVDDLFDGHRAMEDTDLSFIELSVEGG